jgi:hypothetical protein
MERIQPEQPRASRSEKSGLLKIQQVPGRRFQPQALVNEPHEGGSAYTAEIYLRRLVLFMLETSNDPL